MKILIIDDMHRAIIDNLVEAGHTVDYLPDIEASKVKKILPDYAGLIVRSKVFVGMDLLENCTELRFVGRAGAGTDNLDHRYLHQNDIQIFNAPEGNRDAVGDHTLALILGLTKHITRGNNEIQRGIWDREANRGIELNSLTIGIIGFGNTGSEVARRLLPFAGKILAYDKYKEKPEFSGVEFCSMDKIFKEAKLVTFHIPLTQETKYLINDDFIGSFRENLYLINTSRGKIAKNSALVNGLKNRNLLGLGLDVLENEDITNLTYEEKKDFDFLSNHPDVIITPHVAGWSKESYKRISEVLAKKILSNFYGHSE